MKNTSSKSRRSHKMGGVMSVEGTDFNARVQAVRVLYNAYYNQVSLEYESISRSVHRGLSPEVFHAVIYRFPTVTLNVEYTHRGNTLTFHPRLERFDEVKDHGMLAAYESAFEARTHYPTAREIETFFEGYYLGERLGQDRMKVTPDESVLASWQRRTHFVPKKEG